MTKAEANAWWARNKNFLSLHDDKVLEMIERYDLKPLSTLEIGCANGYRLEAVNKLTGSEVYGIELADEAIKDKPECVNLFEGDGLHCLQKSIHKYDLIITNYVLHWIDRADIMLTLAYMDSCLNDGGYIIIGDFARDFEKVADKNNPGNYTWKMDYAGVFKASGLYQEVCRIRYNSGTHLYEGLSDYNMGECVLLQKKNMFKEAV